MRKNPLPLRMRTHARQSITISREAITGIDRAVATDSYLSQAKIALALDHIHANYLRYQDDRVRERDHHGAWDVAINLAETEAEIAGLRFAEKALA